MGDWTKLTCFDVHSSSILFILKSIFKPHINTKFEILVSSVVLFVANLVDVIFFTDWKLKTKAWILNQLSTVMVVHFGAFLLMLFSKDKLLQMKQKSELIWDATPQIYGLGNPLINVFLYFIYFLLTDTNLQTQVENNNMHMIKYSLFP